MIYYYTPKPAVLCRRCNSAHNDDNPGIRAIGSSSETGFVFKLYIYDDIPSLEKWRERWSSCGNIVTSQGVVISPDEMDMIITFPENVDFRRTAEWYAINNAEPGLHGLAHMKIGYQNCVGHGSTWDLIHKRL